MLLPILYISKNRAIRHAATATERVSPEYFLSHTVGLGSSLSGDIKSQQCQFWLVEPGKSTGRNLWVLSCFCMGRFIKPSALSCEIQQVRPPYVNI